MNFWLFYSFDNNDYAKVGCMEGCMLHLNEKELILNMVDAFTIIIWYAHTSVIYCNTWTFQVIRAFSDLSFRTLIVFWCSPL